MKKSAITSFFIIIGLLVLCVMTLVAVYATVSESPVLLLDESFSHIDENKWAHEVSECREDGDQFEYYRAEGESGLTADGVLHVQQPAGIKLKREALSNCESCWNCSSSLLSARLRTRTSFYAGSGKIEIRAKFRKGDWMRFRVGIVSNGSESEEASESFLEKADSAQIGITFESAVNRTVLKSEAIADSEFHIYEVEWNPNKISLSTDHRVVDERTLEPVDPTAPPRNTTADLSETPFYINIGVDFPTNVLEKFENESSNHTNGGSEAHVVEVDYIKLFRIGN